MKLTHKPGYFRSIADQIEFDQIVETLRKQVALKPKPTIPDGMTLEEAIFALQSPSMQATMRRPVDQDDAWIARLIGPLPEGALHEDPYAKRDLSPEEVTIEEKRRRGSKNTLGQSKLSSVTELGKQRGISAIIHTPPAKVTREQVEREAVNLTAIVSTPLPQEEWKEMTWFQAFKHWLKGNKIRVD